MDIFAWEATLASFLNGDQLIKIKNSAMPYFLKLNGSFQDTKTKS